MFVNTGPKEIFGSDYVSFCQSTVLCGCRSTAAEY